MSELDWRSRLDWDCRVEVWDRGNVADDSLVDEREGLGRAIAVKLFQL